MPPFAPPSGKPTSARADSSATKPAAPARALKERLFAHPARPASRVAGGAAQLALPPGRYTVVATKPGLVRSFAERTEVR